MTRHCRDTAISDARTSHNIRLSRIEFDKKRGRDDADIELAALRDLEEFHASDRRRTGSNTRHDDGANNFGGLEQCLAIADEEVGQRHGALALGRREHKRRVKRQEHGCAIADRRARGQITTKRGTIANLPSGKNPEHFRERRVFTSKCFLDGGQRSRGANAPLCGSRGYRGKLGHTFNRDQLGKLGKLLVQLHADLRRTGHQTRRGMCAAKGMQFSERRGTEEIVGGRAIAEICRRADRLLQALSKRIVGVCRIALRQGIERRVANRTIPRATAEVASQLVTDLPRFTAVLAVISLEQRNNETGRTKTAL